MEGLKLMQVVGGGCPAPLPMTVHAYNSSVADSGNSYYGKQTLRLTSVKVKVKQGRRERGLSQNSQVPEWCWTPISSISQVRGHLSPPC